MTPNARIAFALAAMACALAGAAAADDVAPDALVDGLEGIFGKHEGKRRSHAKGICVKGTFTPTAGSAALTKSASFAKPVAVLGRYSIGGGNPVASDKSKTGRGLAFRLDPDGSATSDFVFLTAPIFFAKSAEQALGFLQARKSGPDGKPDAAAVKAFSDANPETTFQGKWIAARPVPASYASTAYHSIHALVLTNADGKQTVAKLKLVPSDGEIGLDEETLKTKNDTFLSDEIKVRLATKPAEYRLVAFLARDGDPVADPTVEWAEAGRETAELGTLSIAALEEDATCDAGTFDPTNLAEGIAGSEGDTVLPARSGAYAVSLTRRAAP